MDPFGGPPHSFPRTNGGSKATNREAHCRRGPRRRPLRPPAWVHAPIVTSQCPSFSSTSTTTSRSSHVQYHCSGTLQPITRFFHPQDGRIPDGLFTSALRYNRFLRECVRILQDASPDQREQLFWDLCRCVLIKFFGQLYLPPPGPQIPLSRKYLRSQTELAVYHATNRYQQEFEEEEELGRGGFGRVVRARNKLDGHYYAIKMIITEDMDELSPETCVEEVRTLAKLDHPQVVRYYTAWIQQDVWLHPQWTSATVRELSSDTSDDSSAESSSENSVSPCPSPACQGASTPSDESVVFQDTGAGEVEAQPPSPSSQSIQQQPRHTQGHTHLQENARACGILLTFKPWRLPCPKKVLYIQMRLCGESLRKWMDNRNTSKSPVVVGSECLRIFHQMVKAVYYIHHKGYMHRDIKPENVFFTVEGGNIQLGDFGLARLIVHPPSAPSAAHHTSLTPVAPQTYTLNVGTPLYTAPEVKCGKYGQKSDMYSLGIVLLELFMPFKTNFERSRVISNLEATGDLDPEVTQYWPLIACWIKRLADQDPANRPTAKELLESPLFPPPQPPPSPTTTTTTTGETGAGGLSRLALTHIPRVVEAAATAVEVIQSEFTSVNTIEINQIKTEKSVDNCTFGIEESLSKDEQIAVLKKENDALKRQVEALKLDLERCKIDNASQRAEN